MTTLSPAQSDREQLVFGDRVHELYLRLRFTLPAVLINGTILLQLLWHHGSHRTLLLSWFAAVVVLTVLRSYLAVRYFRQPHESDEARRWGDAALTGALLNGCLWGAAGVIFYPANDIAHQVLLVFVLGGMIAGAAFSVTTLPKAFLAFAVPAAVPICLRLLLEADEIHLGLGAMMALFVTSVGLIGNTNSQATIRAIRLSHQNSSLLNGLALAHARLTQHAEVVNDQATRLQTIVERATDGIITLDLSGMITSLNPAVERLFGYPAAELIGASVRKIVDMPQDDQGNDLVPLDDAPTRSSPAGTLASGLTAQTVGRRKDGSEFAIDLGVARMELAQTLCYNVIVHDTTAILEHERLQNELLHVQKMDALGRLAGGIAHDFSNVLMAIKGYCMLADANLDSASEGHSLMKNVERVVDQSAGLTRQLLDFSRKGPSHPTLVNISNLVRTSEGLLRHLIGRNIEVRFDNAMADAWVNVDPGQMSQVVMNLAINARDAMPNGGTLSFGTTEALRGPGGKQGLRGPERVSAFVMLTVTDTGTGMDKETRDQIFEPFFTTKGPGKGSGLGLSMVYGAVAKAGGTIEVESELGRGTTFRIYLPKSAAPGLRQAKRTTGLHARPSATVLLVEDDALVRIGVRSYLEHLGYDVLESEDSEGALEVSARHAGNIDVLLTDIVLRGMDGLTLAATIRERQPGIQTIVMSGNPELLGNSVQLGARVVTLQKPFQEQTLAETLRAVLQS